jgi:hypothetical protein
MYISIQYCTIKSSKVKQIEAMARPLQLDAAEDVLIPKLQELYLTERFRRRTNSRARKE